jgi:Zn-dependent protease with chaperone function
MTLATAYYFNGRDARLHPADLDVDGSVLRITTASMACEIPLAEVGLTEPFAAAPVMLRLPDGASCEVPAGAARQTLLAALGYRRSAVECWQAHWQAALLALVLLAGVLGVLYTVGVPWIAARLAPAVPPAVEMKLGQATLQQLIARGILHPSRLSEERIADVRRLLPLALPVHPRIPVRLHVFDATLGANAIALPDGTIIVTDALVRLLQTPRGDLDAEGKARLLAVLAHEVGHLEHRHVGRKLVGSSLAAAVSATLFGDFSTAAAGASTLLTNMAYSRDMELEADDYAVEVLRRNGRPPAALADALGALEHDNKTPQRTTPGWLSRASGYLSTHPDSRARIERLRTLPATP